MKLLKALTVIGSLVLLAVVSVPALSQTNLPWDRKTIMTFSQPFEIPGGKILPAGTYVFKLLDAPGNRNVVQIFSENETQVYATVLAVSNHRLQSPDSSIVTFEERVAGSPQAVKAWFYPHDIYGHEFVYPKTRAVELAKLVNESVPSMPAELTPEITAPAKSVSDQPVVALKEAPLKVEEPSGKEVSISNAFESPTEVASLPKTASSIPLVGLIGLLSLVLAFTLLIVTRRLS
jgi:hypothetical protein